MCRGTGAIRTAAGVICGGLNSAEDQALLDCLRAERFQDTAPRQVYATLLSEGQLIASAQPCTGA